MELPKLNSVENKRKGAACEICGLSFISLEDSLPFEHGYPAVCHNCWKHLNGFERQMYRRAKKNTAVH